MGKEMPGIIYTDKKNPTVDADSSLFLLPFYKDSEYFTSLDNFVQFIKAVEALVRKDDRYKAYKAFIINDIGLNRCQVLGNIQPEEEDNTKLDMHHGPILTLFDYASIMIDHILAEGGSTTTFDLADRLLTEHEDHNVQIIMATQTIHEEIHEGNIFISINQAFGDITRFLEKYHLGVGPDYIKKINNYINLCEKYDSFIKNDILKLRDFVSELRKDVEDYDL